MRVLLLLLLTSLGLVAPSVADEKDAETCVRTKIWDGYADGWAVRSATKAQLRRGEYRVYVLTLYAGTEYKFQACGDKMVTNVDLILYDNAGKPLVKDNAVSPEPEMSFKPSRTDAYYIALYAAELTDPYKRVGVALATTYR